MKEKLFPVSLALMILAVIFLVALFPSWYLGNLSSHGNAPTRQNEAVDLKDSYKIDKIASIIDQVLNREIIKDSYFHYISDNADLLEALKKHNERTAFFTGFFSERATGTVIGVFMLEEDDGSPLEVSWSFDYVKKLSPDIRDMIEVITYYSLFRNCKELFCGDPKLAYMIASEAGGSAGMWPGFWHNAYLGGPEMSEIQRELLEYFDFEDGLVIKLEEYMDSLLSIK